MKSTLILIGIFLVFSGCEGQKKNKVNNYDITLGSSLRELNVEANLERVGSYIIMDWEAAEFLPDGWSTYVESIEAFDPDGEKIKLTYEQPGRWLMEGVNMDRVSLKYSIRIGHDDIVWEEGGHDESAYVIEDLLFFIGRAVFVTAGQRPEVPDVETYKISFTNLPENYTLTSIWTKDEISEDTPPVWTAQGTHELIGSVVLVGDQLTRRIRGSGVEIVLSGAQEYKGGIEAFETVFEPLLENAAKVFGTLPESKFVLVSNMAPITKTQEPYFSGGVLQRSMSFVSPFVPDASMLPMVQYVLFHEYLHLYGLGMNLDPDEMYANYWFMEGVHDYMALRLLHGGGLMSDEELLASETGLTGNLNKYLAVSSGLNIRKAGEEKFDNYDLIYSGGHIIGAAMDIAFLEVSDGEYDLLKYLKDVLDLGQAKEKGEYMTFNELRGLALEKGGDAQKEIFKKYVIGNEVLSFEEYLEKVGLTIIEDAEGNKVVEMAEKVDSETASLRDAFFSRSVFQSTTN